MRLNRNTWYVRWFFWSLGIWEEFRDGWVGHHEEQTNLCFFLRTTLVSAPLVLILHLFVFACLIASVTYAPIWLFGGEAYLYVLGSVALLVGLIFTYKMMTRSRREKRREQGMTMRRSSMSVILNQPISQPTFLKVVGKWFVAQKKKVCPTIAFDMKEGVR